MPCGNCPSVRGGWLLNNDSVGSRLARSLAVQYDSELPDRHSVRCDGSGREFYRARHQSYPDCTGDPFAGASTNPKDYAGSLCLGILHKSCSLYSACSGQFWHLPSADVPRAWNSKVDMSLFKSFPIQESCGSNSAANSSTRSIIPTSLILLRAPRRRDRLARARATVTDPREIQLAAKFYF